MSANSDTKARVQQLVTLVEQGRMLDAMAEFYADDVTMQENLNPPTAGLAANLERERAFYGSVRSIHFHALAVLVDGDHATINWVFECVAADGAHSRVDQLAHQVWRDGKIISERFYYDTGARAAA